MAMTVDCNGAYVYLDPYEGGKIAVAEAARNLACSGALPLGVTDNLNFGNPHNPELFWQLRESVRGLAEACRAFNTPVTGGNCSLYNQSPAGPIDPTPTVAMVGLIERPEHITTQWFKDEGDVSSCSASRWTPPIPCRAWVAAPTSRSSTAARPARPPRCDLEREKLLHEALRSWIPSGVIKSAHDCSEGGLAVALAESLHLPTGRPRHPAFDRGDRRFECHPGGPTGCAAVWRNPGARGHFGGSRTGVKSHRPGQDPGGADASDRRRGRYRSPDQNHRPGAQAEHH